MTDIINDINKQPAEEVIGQVLEEFREQKLQASWRFTTILARGCVHQSGNLQEPYHLGGSMEVALHNHD